MQPKTKNEKKKLKQANVITQLVLSKFKIHGGRNQKDCGGKDLWKRWVLSLEWKLRESYMVRAKVGSFHG